MEDWEAKRARLERVEDNLRHTYPVGVATSELADDISAALERDKEQSRLIDSLKTEAGLAALVTSRGWPLPEEVAALRQRVEELEHESKQASYWSARCDAAARAELHLADLNAVLEAKLARCVDALAGLCVAVDDVLRGWDAHRQLAKGFSGMGHNILVESAGKYGSLSCWIRVRRYYDNACAALAAAKGE